MKTTWLGGLVVGTLLTAGLTKGDTIQTSNGNFQAFPTLTEGTGNTAYWDNASLDGSHKGIGYFLTGQSGDATSPNYSSPLWFQGSGQLGSPSAILFNSTGAVTIRVLLHTTLNNIEFGYYDAATPGNTIRLFDTSTSLGTAVTMTMPSSYGFYIHYLSPTPGVDYFKSSSVNSLSTESIGHMHFAAFTPSANSNTMVLGVEDQYGLHSFATPDEQLGDYNDFVVSVLSSTTAVAPEPSTYGLIGLGLASVIGWKRRRG